MPHEERDPRGISRNDRAHTDRASQLERGNNMRGDHASRMRSVRVLDRPNERSGSSRGTTNSMRLTVSLSAMEHEQCAACGFDGSRYDDVSLLVAVRKLGPRWRTVIADAGPELRVRPAADVWSAIEYAAHSRDITALHAFGVNQALTVDEPAFPAIIAGDLIDTAAATYINDDPDAVVAALDTNACQLVQVAGDPADHAWQRGLTIGDERSTVRRMLEHALHDSLHHIDDVERGLRQLRD